MRRLEPEACAVLVIDVQERLAAAMPAAQMAELDPRRHRARRRRRPRSARASSRPSSTPRASGRPRARRRRARRGRRAPIAKVEFSACDNHDFERAFSAHGRARRDRRGDGGARLRLSRRCATSPRAASTSTSRSTAWPRAATTTAPPASICAAPPAPPSPRWRRSSSTGCAARGRTRSGTSPSGSADGRQLAPSLAPRARCAWTKRRATDTLSACRTS